MRVIFDAVATAYLALQMVLVVLLAREFFRK